RAAADGRRRRAAMTWRRSATRGAATGANLASRSACFLGGGDVAVNAGAVYAGEDGVVVELGAVDVGVDLGGFQELFVCASRSDAALVQDQDQIRIADRADALRDHKRGPADHQLLERMLDLVLGGHVNAAGRIVEAENTRVCQKGPRDGDALLMSDASSYVALVNYC